jgi:uncharacterized protein (UPF0333 family)
MKRNGQIIVEYTSLVALALIFAIIISGFLLIQSSRNADERHRIAIDSQLTRIQNEVLSAHASKDGYYSIVEFEPPYLGVRMNLTISSPALIIKSSRTEGLVYLPQTNGSIQITSGNIRIRKTEGMVWVDNI